MIGSRVIAVAVFGVVMTYVGIAAVSSPGQDRLVRPAATVAVPPVAVPQVEFREETAMVLAGAALIGLAAAVRRAA